MFDNLIAILTACGPLVQSLKAENADLRAKLADAEKGKAEAEAAAQALKDALTPFQPSGN